MNLCNWDSPIEQANCGYAFHFAPASLPILLAQTSDIVNLFTDSNGFNIGDFVQNFKVHQKNSNMLTLKLQAY